MLGAAVLTAGCASQPAEDDPTSPLAAPMYMQMAASSDLFEIQSSQLALQMSQNAGVRAFAQMLVADHTRMSNEMRLAAATAGLPTPPPALLPHHAQMLDQLRAAPAGGFDAAYRDVQVMAHQEALTLHQNYANGGDNPALRAVAGRAVPVVQGHLSQAQTLAAPAATGTTPARTGERG
jgi:putative membrane protein